MTVRAVTRNDGACVAPTERFAGGDRHIVRSEGSGVEDALAPSIATPTDRLSDTSRSRRTDTPLPGVRVGGTTTDGP